MRVKRNIIYIYIHISFLFFSFYGNKQLFGITKILPCLTHIYIYKCQKRKNGNLFFAYNNNSYELICLWYVWRETRYKSLTMCDQDLLTTHSVNSLRDEIQLMLLKFLWFYGRTKSWAKFKYFTTAWYHWIRVYRYVWIGFFM